MLGRRLVRTVGPMGVGIVMVIAAVAFALLVNAAVTRRVPLDVLKEHHEVAAVITAIIGGMYGILLAFAVVVVWEGFDRAREDASREANAGADLYRLVGALPTPTGPEIQAAMIEYFRSVSAAEFPAMDRGEESPETEAKLHQIWRAVTGFRPTDDGERNLHLTALQRLSEMSDQRRLRLTASKHEMPITIWVVLIAGALIVIAFANFFGLRFPRSKALLLIGLSGIIALVLATIWGLDHPFSGEPRVRPDDFQLVLRLMTDAFPAAGHR